MKQSLTCFTLLLLAFQLSAQITIERSDYTLDVGQRVYWIPALNQDATFLPDAGENMTWDYSELNFNASDSTNGIYVFGGANPMLPEANDIEVSSVASSIVPGLTLPTTFFRRLDEDGFRALARLDGAADVSIQPFTGSPTDSMNFLETMNLYENPSIISQFPMNFGDAPAPYFLTLKSDFLLTVGAFGLNHVPSQSKFIRTFERNTNGWGTLKVKDPLTGDPVELDVLLMVEKATTVDSFYLGGMPAPAALLNAFGQVQSDTSVSFEYEFWTKGLNAPALLIEVRSSGTITTSVNPGIGGVISSVRSVPEELLPVIVFPNPASNVFQLNFEKTDARDWTFNLYNTIGQMKHQQPITGPVGSGNAEVRLSSPSAGIHHFLLRNSEGTVVASGKVSIR